MDTMEKTRSLPFARELADAPAASSSRYRLLEEWPHVRIDHVDVRVPRAAGATEGIVQAIVHLGDLLPCDAYVEILTEGGTQRLHSAHSLNNGSYVFEAPIPARTLRGVGECTVRITPSVGGTSEGTARPVLRRTLLRPPPDALSTGAPESQRTR